VKKYTTTAIVLKNISYGDANKIYTLLTKDSGKISAAARGVRKITSKRAGSLDSISLVRVELSEDAKGYKSVLEVKCLNSFSNIKADLMCSLGVIYLAELIDKFLENDHKNEEIFALFYHTLGLLNKADWDRDLIIAFFEVYFCKAMGFEMTLAHCSLCHKPFDLTWPKVYFSEALAGFVCDSCKKTEFELSVEVATSLFFLNQGKIQKACSDLSSEGAVILCNLVKAHLDKVVFSESKRMKSRTLLN
jgi:DNA repair protein RecO (recombination protein O)